MKKITSEFDKLPVGGKLAVCGMATLAVITLPAALQGFLIGVGTYAAVKKLQGDSKHASRKN